MPLAEVVAEGDVLLGYTRPKSGMMNGGCRIGGPGWLDACDPSERLKDEDRGTVGPLASCIGVVGVRCIRGADSIGTTGLTAFEADVAPEAEEEVEEEDFELDTDSESRRPSSSTCFPSRSRVPCKLSSFTNVHE